MSILSPSGHVINGRGEHVITSEPDETVTVNCGTCFNPAAYFQQSELQAKCELCLRIYLGVNLLDFRGCLHAYSDQDFGWKPIKDLPNPKQFIIDRMLKGVTYVQEPRQPYQLELWGSSPASPTRPNKSKLQEPYSAGLREPAITFYEPDPDVCEAVLCQKCGHEQRWNYVRRNGTAEIWCFDCFEDDMNIIPFEFGPEWLAVHKDALPFEVRIVNVNVKRK